MTPNLRLDQYTRTLTAFGKQTSSQKYHFQAPRYTYRNDHENNEEKKTWSENEAERVLC